MKENLNKKYLYVFNNLENRNKILISFRLINIKKLIIQENKNRNIIYDI